MRPDRIKSVVTPEVPLPVRQLGAPQIPRARQPILSGSGPGSQSEARRAVQLSLRAAARRATPMMSCRTLFRVGIAAPGAERRTSDSRLCRLRVQSPGSKGQPPPHPVMPATRLIAARSNAPVRFEKVFNISFLANPLTSHDS